MPELKLFVRFIAIAFGFLALACQSNTLLPTQAQRGEIRPLPDDTPQGVKLLLESATEQTKLTKSYNPEYVVLAYPNGDVPLEKGVCTDVIVRAFRKAGIDLQKEVHEDMKANFSAYPKKWGLKKADSNIDHRRVPNLQTFFTRRGKSLPISEDAKNFQPGDVVAWDLNGKGLTHIGIVSNVWSNELNRYLIIHNIGSGTTLEDGLFSWKIIGHYRWF